MDFVEFGLVIDGRPGFGGINDPRRKVVVGFIDGVDDFLSRAKDNKNKDFDEFKRFILELFFATETGVGILGFLLLLFIGNLLIDVVELAKDLFDDASDLEFNKLFLRMVILSCTSNDKSV
jgi:hypothetical protein